jgi:molybdate transport system substrate-binding protein
VLLAADETTPARLEAEGHTVADSRRTYAIGRLTLWSSDPALLSGRTSSILESSQVRHVAIANPDLAPYGAAARQTLHKLGLWPSVAPKLVMAQNVSEAFLMVATGNAQAGFVALASVTSRRNENPGSRWDVPEQYHEPIRQDGALLRHGEQNPAAVAFLEFLHSGEARSIIAGYGYSLP